MISIDDKITGIANTMVSCCLQNQSKSNLYAAFHENKSGNLFLIQIYRSPEFNPQNSWGLRGDTS